MPTKIEWCDETINPVVGCAKCSPGCANCYAERFAARLAKNPKTAERYSKVVDERGRWNGRVDIDFSCFDKLPRQPKSIFLASMGDIFHESISSDSLNALLTLIADRPEHQFCLLTKRAERLAAIVGELAAYRLSVQKAEADLLNSPSPLPSEIHHPGIQWPLKNLWLGVTVCNQEEADGKIPALLSTPAAHRFVSVEPMLGRINLRPFIQLWGDNYTEEHFEKYGWSYNDFSGGFFGTGGGGDPIYDPHPGLKCVIVGGETGPGARPMHPDWVRSLRDQCRAAAVPFFFKGWGEWGATAENMMTGEPAFVSFESFTTYCNKARTWMRPADALICPDGHRPANGAEEGKTFPMCVVRRLGCKKAGRLLDGVEHNERPW